MTLAELEQWTPQAGLYDVADVLVRHVYHRSQVAFAAGDTSRDALKTAEQIRARQAYIRIKLLEGIGGLPSSDTPLSPVVTGIVQGDGFRVEKVIFEARPKHFVTANLYVPEGIPEPGAAVLFVCGHHREAKHHPEYQAVCQRLMRAGLIVLAQDPVGQGERFGYYEAATGETTVTWGTTEHDYAGAQMLPLGDSLARYFLHDSLRAMEYLASRPEVDPARIGVTGNSGGGTQASLLLMTASEHIAAAAPTTFIMNRETYQKTGGAQDAEQIWPQFTEAGLDHEDILLALWPKPLQVQAVTSDFFPIEGTRRTAARCRRFWELAGTPDAFALIEDDSTHAYTPSLANAAAQFFARHLLGKTVPPAEPASICPLPMEQLWCTKSGQIRGELKGAGFAHEDNLRRGSEIAGQRKSVSREAAVSWLRGRVSANRASGDLCPRFPFTGICGDLTFSACLWRPQEDLFNIAYLGRPTALDGKELPVTICLWDGGTRQLAEREAMIGKICGAGRAALICDVSGAGAMVPRRINGRPMDAQYGTLHKLACDLLFLGDDLLSLRVYDVLRTLDLIAAWPGVTAADIELVASGRIGVAGRLAAALDARIKRVTVADGPKSWEEWSLSRHYDPEGIYDLILHRALRYFDLPDLEREP